MRWPFRKNDAEGLLVEVRAAYVLLLNAKSDEERHFAQLKIQELTDETRRRSRNKEARSRAAYQTEEAILEERSWTPGHRWTSLRGLRSMGDVPWAKRTPIAGSIADAVDDGERIGNYGGSTADEPHLGKYR